MSDLPPQFPTLYKDLHHALKDWAKTDLPSPLIYLSLYQSYQRQGLSPRDATQQLFATALDGLAVQYPLHAQLLKQRFEAGQSIQQVANLLNLAPSTVFLKQREAISHLAEVIREMEHAHLLAREKLLARRLPPPSPLQIVGVDTVLVQLLNELGRSDAPWIICIEGMGGIGKTTLTDALARRAVQQGSFDEVVWLSAKPNAFNLDGTIQPATPAALSVGELTDALLRQVAGSAVASELSSTDEALRRLQTLFKAQPHLVVIDNLETLLDVEVLLPALLLLAAPTKFVLTSRKSFFAETLYHFAVPPLALPDALVLFHQEARARNLPALAEVGADSFETIYGTVGGNPLALRLVVGLAHVYEVDLILSDLAAARGEAVENLYTFIYRRAWEGLAEPARRALLSMPFVTDAGGRWEQLEMMSQLDASSLRQALMELVSLNLVDTRGTPIARRYTIHNLTRTFLQNQVAGWK